MEPSPAQRQVAVVTAAIGIPVWASIDGFTKMMYAIVTNVVRPAIISIRQFVLWSAKPKYRSRRESIEHTLAVDWSQGVGVFSGYLATCNDCSRHKESAWVGAPSPGRRLVHPHVPIARIAFTSLLRGWPLQSRPKNGHGHLLSLGGRRVPRHAYAAVGRGVSFLRG